MPLVSFTEKHCVAAAHLSLVVRVELNEVCRRSARFANLDGDGEHRLRDGKHGLNTARASFGQHEPGQVRAGFSGRSDVLSAREPTHLDQWSREKLGQLLRGIGSAHERRSDEDGVGTGELGGCTLGA